MRFLFTIEFLPSKKNNINSLLQKMNFIAISLILYLIGELEPIAAVQKDDAVQSTSIIHMASDSIEKKLRLKYVYELLYKSLSYRYAVEERARVEVNIRMNDFESKTRSTYTKVKPSERKAQKLWNLAKHAEKNYLDSKNRDAFDLLYLKACNWPFTYNKLYDISEVIIGS